MTKERWNELKGSLCSRLADAMLPVGYPRLKWLCDHLDEYIERWKGHVDLEVFTLKKIIRTDFFGIIKIAIEVIDEQLLEADEVANSLMHEWNEFKNTITWIERSNDRNDIPLILKTYERFKKSLAALCRN